MYRCSVMLIALVGFLIVPAVTYAGTWRHDLGTVEEGDVVHQALGNLATYEAVGLLLGKRHRCSGTLIQDSETLDQWVVTAAHCLDRGKANHYTFSLGNQSRSGMQKHVHPDWTGSVVNGSDIALLKLESAFGSDIEPAIRRTDPLIVGNTDSELFVSVGFGLGGTGVTGATLTAVEKRAGNNFAEARGGDPGLFADWSNTIVLNDFDDPVMDESTFHLNAIHLNEFNIASGDSGGGMFILNGTTSELAGVTSLGWATDGSIDSDYGDGGGFTDLPMFNAWIDSVLAGEDNGGDGGGGGGRPPGRGGGRPFGLSGVAAITMAAPVPEPSSGTSFIFAVFLLIPLLRRRR